MPDLRMTWEDFSGSYGAPVADGSSTVIAATGDGGIGGVDVTVEYNNVDPNALAFALNLDTYDDLGDDLPTNSQLKLLNDATAAAGVTDTSSVALSFSSSDALYGDGVSNLTFRIDDIDAGTINDVDDGAGAFHEDIVEIRAYDLAGNLIPVTITPGSAMSVTGQTIDGDSQGLPTDAATSALISIAGPVGRVEIDYANGGSGTQEILISDLLFSTTDATANVDPIANPDSASTEVDTLLEDIDVLGNDSDPDGDALTVSAASAPNGTVTVNPDGTLDYQPDVGFTGTDTITYVIDDGNGGTDTGAVTVTVGTLNTDPDAQPDTATTTAGTAVTIFPLGNDTDPEGDVLTITSATAPDGTVTISPDGTSVTYTPDVGFNNDVDTITYTISDGNGGTDTTTIQVIVGTPGLDGIVEGTAGSDLIDTTYLGDPEGDQIDNSDAIAPETGAQDDVVEAGDGDDTIDAGLGDDYVDAGTGDDVVTTGEGDDTVFGGTGSDDIDTGEGDDSVFSDEGDDTITTGDGQDTILAGLGNDVIDTSGSIPLLDDAPFPSIPTDDDPDDDRDFVDADEGDDLITTGDDDDTIIGGEGNDTINSGIDNDSVIGDGGDDLINDVQGADFVDGGDGNDTINVGLDTFSDYIGDDPN
ncbi:MAG: Ig-like domain-containing protein, partial [Planktotalea sp.]|uniref:Ig-like domain-containing protein n=1 Tax=Planktotalea sp. TaxID=2029877 RepID=UPI003C7328C3